MKGNKDAGVDWPDVRGLWVRDGEPYLVFVSGITMDTKGQYHYIGEIEMRGRWYRGTVSPAVAEGVDYQAKWEELYAHLENARNGARITDEKFAYGRTLNTMDELVPPSRPAEPAKEPASDNKPEFALNDGPVPLARLRATYIDGTDGKTRHSQWFYRWPANGKWTPADRACCIACDLPSTAFVDVDRKFSDAGALALYEKEMRDAKQEKD